MQVTEVAWRAHKAVGLTFGRWSRDVSEVAFLSSRACDVSE
jgi:hypothetical protein